MGHGGPPVRRLTARAFTIPTDGPEADGTFAWDATTLVTVQAEAGDATGLGWTYGPTAVARAVQDDLADVVVGRDAFAITASAEAMSRRVRNAVRTGIAAYAVSAADVALWDLKARLLGLSVTDLLGAVRPAVAVYGSGGFTTASEDELRRQVEGWRAAGVGAVKIKIAEDRGHAEGRDLERMRLVRDLVGDDVTLMVDANGGYTRKQAVRVLQRADDLGVGWFEEPVSPDDLDGLRLVRDSVAADVTAGEYACDLATFARLCSSGAVDCLQIDATRCGGYTEWLRASAVAAAHGLDVSAHCAPHLHVPVAAATRNARHLEWFHDHERIESTLFEGASRVRDGVLPVTPSLGHGMSMRDDIAERFAVPF